MASIQRIALAVLLQALPTLASAAPVAVPHTFSAGTPAKAAEVNANFAALQAAVNALQADLTAAKDRIAVLETRLANVSTLTVNGQPTVRFTGVNVQVVNGLGSTDTANGTGNLVVGYDEPDSTNRPNCTIGTYLGQPVSDSTACGTAGGTWTTAGFKTGSHYLVAGSQNNYSRWGGVVFGQANTANYDWASVTGGSSNLASGQSSSVSGGEGNRAFGVMSSVIGGFNNAAWGEKSSVSGGGANDARGGRSSVCGGDLNTASGIASSILGGTNQTATAVQQAIPAVP
jgi:hypothetical protein